MISPLISLMSLSTVLRCSDVSSMYKTSCCGKNETDNIAINHWYPEGFPSLLELKTMGYQTVHMAINEFTGIVPDENLERTAKQLQGVHPLCPYNGIVINANSRLYAQVACAKTAEDMIQSGKYWGNLTANMFAKVGIGPALEIQKAIDAGEVLHSYHIYSTDLEGTLTKYGDPSLMFDWDAMSPSDQQAAIVYGGYSEYSIERIRNRTYSYISYISMFGADNAIVSFAKM